MNIVFVRSSNFHAPPVVRSAKIDTASERVNIKLDAFWLFDDAGFMRFESITTSTSLTHTHAARLSAVSMSADGATKQ